jgi:hypothetical protein
VLLARELKAEQLVELRRALDIRYTHNNIGALRAGLLCWVGGLLGCHMLSTFADDSGAVAG